jgi:hypothetical protein
MTLDDFALWTGRRLWLFMFNHINMDFLQYALEVEIGSDAESTEEKAERD